MKKYKIENILHSKGYVSIETLIVAGLILAGGAFLVSKFILSGKKIGDKSNDVLVTAQDTIEDNAGGQTPPTTRSYFTYKDVTGGIQITGYSDEGPKDVIIPSTINGKTVVSIGQKSFANKKLTSVVIPNTVKEIENAKSWPNGAFFGNPITSVVIPDSLEILGDYAFYDNPITSLTLGKNVKYIGNSAFREAKLKKVEIPDTVETIADCAFWGTGISELKLGNSVKSIGSLAFYSCKFTDLIIPNSVETIGYSSFKYCGIKNLTLGNSIKTIGEEAFLSNSIKTLNLPSSIKEIKAQAFKSNHFTDIYIPDGTIINGNAFDNIELKGNIKDYYYKDVDGGIQIIGYFGKDKDVTIPSQIDGKNIVSIGAYAFANKGLTNITIPDSVISIGGGAFCGNNLTSVTIPDKVTSIGDSAFLNNKLTSVNLGNSVTSIESYAFQNNQLTEIKIPDSVTSVGPWSFYNNKLTSVTISKKTSVFGKDAFGKDVTIIIK